MFASTEEPVLLQAVVHFAVRAEHGASTAALQAEEQEFGVSQGCGFCSVACQVCPLALALHPAAGATGWGSPSSAEPLQGSPPCAPIAGHGHPPNRPRGWPPSGSALY